MALTALKRALTADLVLSALLVACVVLTALDPKQALRYPALVEWPTIAALAGLLTLTKGLEASGALHALGRWLLERLASERAAALSLVASAALLSTLLTNDVALFIIVPLTLSLCKLAGLKPTRFIIFEAFAVNAGSTLTPIGNPQNLFLWQRSGASFLSFTAAMAPLVAFMMVSLLLLTAIVFKGRPLKEHHEDRPAPIQRSLLALSLVLYGPFLVLTDMRQAPIACAAVMLAFTLFEWRVLKQLDWGLLLVFVLMFIVLRSFAALPLIQAGISQLGLEQPRHLFLAGIAASQVVSNVPAAIALAESSNDWRMLALGVNVGGFGLGLGSLANLIALRLGNDRAAWREFHGWSVPVLAVIAIGCYAALFWL